MLEILPHYPHLFPSSYKKKTAENLENITIFSRFPVRF